MDIIDHVTKNYGVFSRADLSILDKRMLTYVPSQSLAQNFTVFDDTHALLLQRNFSVADINLTRQPILCSAIRHDPETPI